MARSNTVALDLPSYPTAQALIEDQAGRIFLHLEEHSFAETGYIFGLDRYLKNENSMRGAITRAYNLVLADPIKFDLPPEKVAYIHGLVSARGIAKKKPETLREENDIKKADISTMVLESRDLVTGLVRKKLDYLDRNPKALKEMSLKEIMGAFQILFDKGQIIQGAATEHIAVLSNIKTDMGAEEALEAIIKMREQMIERQ